MGISFRKALLSALSTSDKSLEQIAQEAGIAFASLEALVLSDAAHVSVDDAIKVAQSFGTTLDHFLEDSSLSGHIQIAQLYSSLPPLLKAQLEAYAQELADGNDPSQSPKRQ